MNNNEARELLEKFNKGKASSDEIKLLERWYIHEGKLQQADPEDMDYGRIKTEMWDKIHLVKNNQSRSVWPRIAVAASILLMLSFGAYFLNHRLNPQTIAQNQFKDIAPGSDKAILTLASGRQIVITGAKAGLLTSEGNTAINITAGNQVVYSAGGAQAQLATTQYNTMTTPRGGQHQLTLADGTRVWLDAASSITFPVAFAGDSRPVKITGQVYFEVAHNPAKPFRVTANGQTVEVLGTHFNINAYADEPGIKTTLFEGSVKVSVKGSQAVLKPGQQSIVQSTNKSILVNNSADLDEVIAWHKGLFKFHDADVPTVMRQLSRWYDVEVAYEGEVPDQLFSGEMYRNISALKVSDILSYEKIHFRIEGKKIIVTP